MASISRRGFLKGAGVVGGVALVGSLVGCAAQAKSQDDARVETSASETIEATETKSCDILVVGGGMSGLSAAVSASATGKKVLVVEAADAAGGNGHGTEGIFACGSSLQKEAGINFSFEDVISEEFEFFNYRIDALRWKDLVEASAGNVDWLMEQGVAFDHVDNYRGQGKLDAFHWYAGGADKGYIEPMVSKAQTQGVDFLYGMRARQLIFEEGAVKGAYVQNGKDGYVRIDAQAVILATGGYADSDEKLEEIGVNLSNVVRKGFPHHEGDGLDMAVAVGGVDSRLRHCVMREPGCLGYDFESPLGAMGIRSGGPFLFVNENGERYTNEGCIVGNQAYAANCVLSQKTSFALLDNAVMKSLDAVVPGFADSAQDAYDKGARALRADTIEELADFIDVDAKVLASTLERYNRLCDAGHDSDFGKDASMMQALAEGPYWAFEHGFFYFSTIGGIETNRNFEVVDAHGQPIPGLWAVGTDGCELYKETYTVMMPASCMANNINSGRRAGLDAITYCDA